VNKHFFAGGVRVASSATVWAAPSGAALAPLRWRGVALRPPPASALAGALYAGLGLLGVGLALRRREELGGRRLALRLGATGTVVLVSPALLASPCGVPPPAPSSTLGTHGEAVLFYATDQLGSTILSLDATGAVHSRRAYLPYGDPALEEGAALRQRFAGGEVTAQTGLYVLGARVYDPELGRFLQPDPLVADPADPQAFNRYAYGRNNPLSWLDPSGLYAEAGFGLSCGEYSCGGGDAGGWDRELDPGITPGHPDYYGVPTGPPQILLPYDPSGGSTSGAPTSRSASSPPAPNQALHVPVTGEEFAVGSQGGEPWYRAGLMTVGEWSRGEDVLETIAGQRSNIESAASQHGVDPNLIRATIYEEQTHLWPFEGIAEPFGVGDTVGLGQVTVGYYGYTREQLLDPATNINAVARHLSTIQGQPLIDPSNPVGSIASRYNKGSATSITPYGRRVSGYFNRFSSGVWP